MKPGKLTGAAILLAAATVLSACSPSEPQNLAAGQKRAMDKARAVEEQLKDAAAQQREQIDELAR